MSSFPIIGEGSIHAVSGAANVAKTTFTYSEESILPFESPEDYGNVQGSVLTSDDYGTVTQSETVANVDNRYIFFSTTATPYGLGKIGGAVTNVSFKASATFVSTGELVEISGDAGINFKPDYQGRGTLSALNGSADSFGPRTVVDVEEFHTRLYEVVGIAGERNAFSYNEKSILPNQSDDDFGTIISSSTSSDDYGTVTQSETVANNDYRYVYFDDVAVPYGTITIGGESINEVITAFRHNATGGPEVSGNADIKFRPDYQGRGTLSALNGSADSFGPRIVVDIEEFHTRLYEVVGIAGERNAFSYNEKSIVPDQGGDDLGSITSVATGTEDFGSVGDSEFTQPYEDRRYIYFNDVAVPYGTISIGGASENEVLTAFRHNATGGPEVSGNAGVKFKPDYQGRGTLSALNGSADSLLVDLPIEDITENINLFDIEGILGEKTTFSYNEKSIVPDQSGDDFGSIASSSTSSEDFGTIGDSEFTQPYEDRRYIYFNDVAVPYGTITIGGGVEDVKFESALRYSGSGTANVSGNAGIKFKPDYQGRGTLSALNGSAEVFGVNPPDQTVLFEITGTKIERKTFSYTDKSIFVFGGYDDHGQVSAGTTSTDDFGSVNDSANYTDNGNLQQPFTQTTHPYGTISILGSADEKDVETFISDRDAVRPVTLGGNRVEKSNFREVGSGSLSALGGSAESFGANPPENIVLFDISGTKVEKSTFREISSGSAEFSGTADNVYNPGPYTASGSAEFSGKVFDTFKPDYQASGSFSAFGGAAEVSGVNPPDQTVLFEVTGTKVEKGIFREIFSGTIEASGTAGNIYNPGPYTASGSAEFSGKVFDTFKPNYQASGSISALGGSAESFGANPPENVALFDVSGTKVEKGIFREIFSGTIEASGTKVENSTFREISSGSATISGSAAESFTPETEIGSGSFSAFGGGAEFTGVNPPDQTILFEVSGGYNNLKATFAHEGTGTVLFSGEADTTLQLKPRLTGFGDISISSNTILADYARTIRLIGNGSFAAFGGGAESTGSNPPENIALFEVSGEYNNLKATFAHEGTGTINVSGDGQNKILPNYTGSGIIGVIDSAAESFTPETEIGSGSFSAFGGGAEFTGVNPPDNVALFKISGGASDLKSKYAHDGAGTINVSGDSTSKSLPKYITSGTATISGSAAESFTPETEIGSGSFAAFGGHVESVGANPPENIALFEVSGEYNNLKATFAHEGTGTINVSGTAVEKYLPKNVGTGSFSAFGSGADSTGSNPPDQTVLFTFSGTKVERFTPGTVVGSGSFSAFGGHVESVGANPPENIALFEVSGDSLNKGIFREIGSGSVSAFGGGAEFTSVNPPNQTAQLEFGGAITSEKGTFREVGSGSLTAFNGSANLFGANPPENVALFDVSGIKVEKSTFREISSGNINISGTMNQGVQIYVPVITGSGNVGISVSSTERITSDNSVNGVSVISGTADNKFISTNYEGSGTIAISGISTSRVVEFRAPYVFVTII